MAKKVNHRKDKKISILEKVCITNSDGYQDIKYRYKYKDIFAYYRHLSGKEIYACATYNYKVDVIFEINFKDDIDTTMVILYNNKLYEMTDIDDFEGKKQTLKIQANKIGNDDFDKSEMIY